MKMDLFQSCGHCWVFQICWYIECSTFTASSFRIWNSSAGIPSPPLALFVVRLPKAFLTSHSRMCGSRWVTTPSRLSDHYDLFLYSSSVYPCIWCEGSNQLRLFLEDWDQILGVYNASFPPHTHILPPHQQSPSIITEDNR